jgi:hypothetical protein
MNNSTDNTKIQPQFDKGQNPSSPVKTDPSIDKADASTQEAKAAPAKEATSDASRR